MTHIRIEGKIRVRGSLAWRGTRNYAVTLCGRIVKFDNTTTPDHADCPKCVATVLAAPKAAAKA